MVLSSAVHAATPEDEFTRLYGEQANRTSALRDPKITEEFVQGLIKDAGDLKDDPKFQAVVYSKAYVIALRGGVYSAAEEAMEKLSSAQPAARGEADEKLLIALERDRRPSVRAKEAATRARVVAVKRLEHLEHAVKNIPNKRDAVELVQLLLVEFDDPTKASIHISATKDDALTHIVNLALRKPADLSEHDAKDLGDWFQARLATASVNGRAIALDRAKACYERFLAAHSTNDADRLEVKHRLDALAKMAISSLGATAASGKWIDLLGMIDATKHAKAGNWKLENGVLMSNDANGARIQIPYIPPEEYDYRVFFSRNEGSSAVVQFASRQNRQILWCIGWRNSKFGLNDKDVDQKCELKNGDKNTSLIKVRRGSVQFFLNDRLILEENDEARLLDSGTWYALQNKSLLGVGSHFSPTSFYKIEVREISGVGKQLPEK